MAADASGFETDEEYHISVFNETLYHVSNPVATLSRDQRVCSRCSGRADAHRSAIADWRYDRAPRAATVQAAPICRQSIIIQNIKVFFFRRAC